MRHGRSRWVIGLALPLGWATSEAPARADDTGLAAAAPSADAPTAAKEKYRAGAEAYKNGRYEAAIADFLDANRLAPSAALSFDVARAYEKLSDASNGLRWYRDYLRRANDPEDAASVHRTMEKLDLELVKKGLQQVTVLSEPAGATVAIDGHAVGTTPWTGDLGLGSHHATLRKKGFTEADRDFVLSMDEPRDVFLPLEGAPRAGTSSAGPAPHPAPPSPKLVSVGAATAPPVVPESRQPPITTASEAAVTVVPRDTARKPPGSPLITWGWVTLGAGGAALGGAIVFEALRASSANAAKHATTQVSFAENANAADSHQTTARVLAGVGAALTITGGTLLVVGFGKKKKEPSVNLAVSGTPTSGSVWVAGKF